VVNNRRREDDMTALKAGARLKDEATGVEAVVVRVTAESSLELRPGGPAALGKRYTCAVCEAQVLVAKAGAAEPVCHGEPMSLAQAKPLPSSD
jgi:hypothetical protein